MNKKKTGKFKSHLESLRAELLGDVEKNRKSSQTEGFTEMLADVTDDAARSSSRQMILNLSEQGLDKLKQIDEALEKIGLGEYGTCTRCENSIPEPRLKVVPFALHCVACLNEIEKEQQLDRTSPT